MLGRKLILILLVVLVAGAAAADDMLVITKGFFNELPNPAQICAQLTSTGNVQGTQTAFFAKSIFGVNATTATGLTDSLGRVCANVNWPRGVYAVQANAGGLWSQFVASTVANPTELDEGVAGGGAVALFHSGVFPFQQNSFAPRFATFGILWNYGQPNIPFQLLYFDHENPDGPLKFVAKSFMQYECFGVNSGTGIEFIGNGTLQIGNNAPKYVRYLAVAIDDDPFGDFFAIELKSFANQLLYTSFAEIGYEGAVINGEVEVSCL